PSGGHVVALARKVNHAANRPEKNISSEASHTTMPTCSGSGVREDPCPSSAVVSATRTFYQTPWSSARGPRRDHQGGWFHLRLDSDAAYPSPYHRTFHRSEQMESPCSTRSSPA